MYDSADKVCDVVSGPKTLNKDGCNNSGYNFLILNKIEYFR